MTARIERIRPHWHWIRPQIELLIAESPAMRGLLPEDVFHACEAGEAFCVVADEGFAVVMVDHDRTTDEKSLYIWMAGSKELGGNNVFKYMPFFRNLAKELGCVYLSTKTAFPEVGEHLTQNGWTETVREYTTAVT